MRLAGDAFAADEFMLRGAVPRFRGGLHGGTVTVTSPQGAGATFELRLPLTRG